MRIWLLKFIIGTIFFVGLSLSSAFAGSIPQTVILHDSPDYFAADARLLLEAQLKDPLGVEKARCYFKTDADQSYLYIAMQQLDGKSFQCILPELRTGTGRLEYFFLIVNKREQVIRSTSYFSIEADLSAVEQENRTNSLNVLEARHELGSIDPAGTSIIDARINLAPTTEINAMYGLRAGVYEQEEIPDTLQVMSGYFGGFNLEPDTGEIIPVKGYAPMLSQSPSNGAKSVSPSPNALTGSMDSSYEEKSTAPEIQSDTSPPQIGGTEWYGYFTRTDSDLREELTATVELDGYKVTITTSLVGLGHFLAGNINSSGDMLLYDTYDGEDWTTHYGPATSTEINIYDYIWRPVVGEPEPPLNAIILYRAPLPPTTIQASDGIYPDEITVDWNTSEGATLYDIYSCTTELTESCALLSKVSGTHYTDTRKIAGKKYFRVQACNSHGCGQFSNYDTGYNQLSAIFPAIHFLLRSG